MSRYEEILKSNNSVQNAFALEYFFLNGRNNLLDDNYYNRLQDSISKNNDKGSLITNEFALESLKIARDMARLDTRELCKYIYEEEKYRKKQEKER